YRGDRLEARTQLARLVLIAQRVVAPRNSSTDRLDLSNKYHQGCARCHGQPPIALVTDDCCQFSEPEQASCRNDAELTQVPAHTVHQLRALTDQLRAGAVQRRQTLLVGPLHRHERHARPCHRLTDRGGITRIRLAALDIGLDVLRRHQFHRVPELGDFARPIMCTAAGLHPDQTRRQLSEERQHLLASELPGHDDLALGIDPVHLEHLLCKVEPDGGISGHGRPSLVIRLQRSLYGTSMPCEAPSTSSNSGSLIWTWPMEGTTGGDSSRWIAGFLAFIFPPGQPCFSVDA